MLRRALAYLLAVWGVHAVLRTFLLARDDAFGNPFVGKIDWYIFHAWAIDWRWIVLWSAPLVAAAALCEWFRRPRAARRLFHLLAVFHSLALLATVFDHETARFMGGHLTPTLVGTYGNGAAARQVLTFVGSDLSVPYLPYALVLGTVPAALGLFALLHRRLGFPRRLRRTLAGYAVAFAACWLFLDVVWPGGFRERKLMPVVEVWSQDLRARNGRAAIDPGPLVADFRARWLLAQGDSDWVFPDTAYPFLRVPRHLACGPGDAACALDGDGDGFVLSRDCDDGDSRVHPGATDAPYDGRDGDCNGIDRRPPNFLLLILESHSAVNAGFLRRWGSTGDATPFLDSIAPEAEIWTRYTTPTVPTIRALMAIHLSMPDHPARNIATDFVALRQRSFTTVLARHGYATRYVSAADPAWDNQPPWLRQWYQGWDYDRGRETDARMFRHLAKWMRDSMRADRPFLVAAMTKSNHYPFVPPPDMPAAHGGAPQTLDMGATMRYTEHAVDEFIATIRSEPWFRNTIVVVTGDHAFPLGQHGEARMGYGGYIESFWVPFVLWGRHPKLVPGRIHEEPAGHLDLGPTLLGLAGIRDSVAYAGHDLLRPRGHEFAETWNWQNEEGAFERGPWRAHGNVHGGIREEGPELFDATRDRLETVDLHSDRPLVHDTLVRALVRRSALVTWTIERNRLWPDSAARRPGGGADLSAGRPVPR